MRINHFGPHNHSRDGGGLGQIIPINYAVAATIGCGLNFALDSVCLCSRGSVVACALFDCIVSDKLNLPQIVGNCRAQRPNAVRLRTRVECVYLQDNFWIQLRDSCIKLKPSAKYHMLNSCSMFLRLL